MSHLLCNNLWQNILSYLEYYKIYDYYYSLRIAGLIPIFYYIDPGKSYAKTLTFRYPKRRLIYYLENSYVKSRLVKLWTFRYTKKPFPFEFTDFEFPNNLKEIKNKQLENNYPDLENNTISKCSNVKIIYTDYLEVSCPKKNKKNKNYKGKNSKSKDKKGKNYKSKDKKGKNIKRSERFLRKKKWKIDRSKKRFTKINTNNEYNICNAFYYNKKIYCNCNRCMDCNYEFWDCDITPLEYQMYYDEVREDKAKYRRRRRRIRYT